MTMAATSNLYQSIFHMVDKSLDNYVQQGSARMIEFLVPVFTSMMIIWVAIWGYSLMFGSSEQPLQEGFYRILRIGFILTLGLTVGRYNQTVVRFLSETPQLLASDYFRWPFTKCGLFIRPPFQSDFYPCR